MEDASRDEVDRVPGEGARLPGNGKLQRPRHQHPHLLVGVGMLGDDRVR